jgi:hypothetical protein
VPTSVLDAIKLGIWDFEPAASENAAYQPTRAMPGSFEKLAILAQRVEQGLPLWHPNDRRCYDESEREES